MRNWIRIIPLTAAVVGAGAPAAALTNTSPTSSGTVTSVGTCAVTYQNESTETGLVASVVLKDVRSRSRPVGGAWEPNGKPRTVTDMVSDFLLSECLNVPTSEVAYASTPASFGTSYASTDVVGFTYKVGDADAVEVFIGDRTKLNTLPVTNTAPTLNGTPASVTGLEDAAVGIDLSSASFDDPDGDNLTVTISASAGTLTATSGGNVTVSGSGTSSLSLAGTATDINTFLDTLSNIKYTTAANSSGNGVATLTILATDGTDPLVSNQTVSVNATSIPDVTGVTSSTANGSYKEGDQVSIQVKFDESVTVIGKPTLTLETGITDRALTYVDGSGTNTLNFTYTVQAGDTSGDLDYTATTALSLNGATIQNLGLYDADLTLASPGATGSLAANKALVIDTTAPVLTDAQIALSGATGTSGAFKLGDIVTASWDGSNGDGDAALGSVTVDFTAFGGGTAVTATLSGSTWSATYQITSSSTTGANVNVSVTATDEAGNATTTADTTNATVDATAPVVTDANISLSGATGTNGAFKIGDTVKASWDNTATGDNNTDIASVTFDFSLFGGSTAVMASNSGGTWTATYAIVAGTIDATNGNVSVAAVDAAGNSSNTAGAYEEVVDNIAPSVVDGDIAVSGGTGPSDAFKVGDTVTVAWTANQTDTIAVVNVDFSDFGGGSSVTATQSNGVWTATFDLAAGSLDSSSLELSVTAYDNAGNLLTTTKATVYTVNTLIPSVEVRGPTEVVTERFSVKINFNEDVSSDLIASELRVENGSVASVSAVSGSSSAFTADIDPVLGETVLVQVLAGAVTNSGGNPNSASNEFTVSAGSPASEFDTYREEIRQVVIDDAARSLTSTLSANQRMTQQARNRFIEGRHQMSDEADDLVSRHSVPFDVDGSFEISGGTLSTRGAFFEQTGNYDGTQRRLFFGDFDVQHDGDTDSSTATLSARVAWEQMTSDTTMLGYFVGGELATSNISGAFEGDQDRVAVTVGGYAVHQLADELFLDGFLSYSIGRNNLEMANDVLALTSDYTTRTATAGAALSGLYEYERYEFRPELAFSYGKTWIGNVGFTGRAYGLVDDTLSLNAGTVSVANLTLRPEVIWALDADTVAESRSQLSFSPRLVCEHTIAFNQCGGGAEVGLSSISDDGMSNIEFRVLADRVGSSTRSSFAINLEHRF